MSHALHAATLRAIRDTNDVDRLAALRSSVEHAYGRDPIGQRLVVLIIEKIRQLTRPPPPRLPDEPGG